MQTPSQTVGPYFAYSLTAPQYGYDHTGIATGDLASAAPSPIPHPPSPKITISGRVLDGKGEPISDAMIEFWQPDRKAFGRLGTGTGEPGSFIFQTLKPAAFDGQAPHLVVIVFMRGLLLHAYTRLYFADEAAANAADEVLNSVPAERRQTLIAKGKKNGGHTEYPFDIVMQGERETVFFDI